jgi:carboxyl-terminal processing protease
VTEQQETPSKKIKKSIHPAIFFVCLGVVLVLGYLTGTQHQQIVGTVVNPIIGLNTHEGEIDLSSVQETYRELASNFYGDLDEQALIDGASRGLVEAAGDDYTVYLDADEANEFNNSLSGNIGGGIGAEIGVRDEQVTIIRVLPDNPAESSGLNAGDKIIGVNDESTEGWTVQQAVEKIRGEEGTTVKISVLRGNEVKEFDITRDIINNPSVVTSIEDSVGVLRLTRFDNDTARLTKAAAQEFINEDVQGIVVDLRGNGGGYLTAARDVAGLWLNDKIVVNEKAGDRVVDTVRTKSSAVLSDIPTVVLLNASSASASEILAAALRDHGAAKIVGERSFGKGSVQRLIELPGNSLLKVTFARWYTPEGLDISADGVVPDKKVELTQEDINADRDPQLLEAIRMIKG